MIEFQEVCKDYQGVTAVTNFSLTIDSHQALVLLGSSGSGKTTLLRMINAMEHPSSGHVLIDGQDVASFNPVKLRRSIGYVMQAGGLLPHRTVLNNVTTVLRLNGVGKKEAKRRGLEMMELLDLDLSLADRYPSELSGGQAQRVGVARALCPKPNILLMDEPFGALDPLVRLELQQLTKNLHKELGTTIVFVTHDVSEAFNLADQIVLLCQHGQIVQQGKASELIENPASDFVSQFLGLKDRNLAIQAQGENYVVKDRHGVIVGTFSGRQLAEADAK